MTSCMQSCIFLAFLQNVTRSDEIVDGIHVDEKLFLSNLNR